ncbi:MAG TPA: helix-turn-helix transcriptional regulator [Agriterribacter sp.]|nr:helix-turn-helix transcriptional regulator [Agriterribacter sp.]
MATKTTFGKKLRECREDKGLSQQELAKTLKTSHSVIGRYERNEVLPSIEIAAKIANALEVSLDYLVGAFSFVVKDKKMLHRLELLEKIDDDDRETILKVVDNYLTTAQLQTTSKKLKQKA